MSGARDQGEVSLFEQEGELGREQRRTLSCHVIDVPPGVAVLKIFFDYQPRRVTDEARATTLIAAGVDAQLDEARAAGVQIPSGAREALLEQPALVQTRAALRNLLNLALVDPSGSHRGRWDQNLPGDGPSREDVLTPRWASPGYVAGAIPAGAWQVTLEAHEVLEPCRYQIRVAALRADVPPAQDGDLRGEVVPPATRQYATPLPVGWVRGELHCHSTASDGLYSPRQLVARAREIGLDFIALTDHNSTSGLEQLADADFPVIGGCEVTTFRGHFLALGLSPAREAPAWYAGEQPHGAARLVEQVRQQGGLFGPAHPFVLGNPVCCGCRLELAVPVPSIDLLEVWSRGGAEPVGMLHALQLFDELRRAGRRVTAVAGRDWHGPQQEQGMDYPATVVQAGRDPASILEAVRRGACYLSVGPVVDLRLRLHARRAGIGDDLRLPPGSRLGTCVEARVGPLPRAGRLRLLRGGRPLLDRAVGQGGTALELPDVSPARGGVRLELWDSAGRPMVLTNPVEFFQEG